MIAPQNVSVMKPDLGGKKAEKSGRKQKEYSFFFLKLAERITLGENIYQYVSKEVCGLSS